MTYTIYPVLGDGACLFNAVAFGVLYYQTNLIPKPHEYKILSLKLRKAVVKDFNEKLQTYKQTHSENLKTFFTGLVTEINSIDDNISENQLIKLSKKYIENLKIETAWAGNFELVSLSKILHKLNFKGIKVINDKFITIIQSKIYKTKNRSIIQLMFSKSHYDFVIQNKLRTDSLIQLLNKNILQMKELRNTIKSKKTLSRKNLLSIKDKYLKHLYKQKIIKNNKTKSKIRKLYFNNSLLKTELQFLLYSPNSKKNRPF